MDKTLLIHNDNIANIQNFDDTIKFSTIQNTLNELKEKEFDVVYIKDSLSSNYMEFMGFVLAYHIRLTTDLGDYTRFLPIVMLSDLDGFLLNKITPLAKVLFTKNIFLNDLPLQISPLNDKNFKSGFLERIEVERPQDTSGEHDIANQWSIYKWANILNVNSEAIEKNREKIQNMLYFKYLKALSFINKPMQYDIQTPSKKGKVLLIDDEWNNGWSDILEKIFEPNTHIKFETFEYDYQDKSGFNLIIQLKHKTLQNQISNADVIVLDLRLLESDHENDTIDNFTGVKILQKIHEINAGIQVIMLTATSKSTILEKLYEKKILGYIKKEHPDDKSIDTIENINKFVGLVDKGLERKYLKKIWDMQHNILTNENLTEDIV